MKNAHVAVVKSIKNAVLKIFQYEIFLKQIIILFYYGMYKPIEEKLYAIWRSTWIFSD